VQLDMKGKILIHGRIASVLRVVSALALAFAAITFATTAFAAGSARLKTPEATEVSGAWHIFVTIELPKEPSTPHVPMRFVLQKTAVYERSLTDNSKEPVNNRMTLQNQTPTTESLDVDFANPQGKVFKGTNFDFGLTRTRGYEAGEYVLQIRTPDGIDVGGKMTLTLKGQNDVVDRRSITFDAKKPGIKKIDDGADAGPKVAKNDTKDSPLPSQEVAPSGSAAPFIPADAYNKTPEEEIKEKPHGCGCTVPGLASTTNSLVGLVGLGAAAMLVALRRTRRRRAPRAGTTASR
jgi:hypothetical protein